MPCYYTGSREGDALFSANEEITELTRMLCRLNKILKKHPRVKVPADIKKWFKEHEEVDRKELERFNEIVKE